MFTVFTEFSLPETQHCTDTLLLLVLGQCSANRYSSVTLNAVPELEVRWHKALACSWSMKSLFPVPDNIILFFLFPKHCNMMKLFFMQRLLIYFSLFLLKLISFNIRTELEITQFLNVAIVIENELKLYVGLQAAGKYAAKFLQT